LFVLFFAADTVPTAKSLYRNIRAKRLRPRNFRH